MAGRNTSSAMNKPLHPSEASARLKESAPFSPENSGASLPFGKDELRARRNMFMRSGMLKGSGPVAEAINHNRSSGKKISRRPFYIMTLYSLLESLVMLTCGLVHSAISFNGELQERHFLATTCIVLLYFTFQQLTGSNHESYINALRKRCVKMVQLLLITFAVFIALTFATKISNEFSRLWTGTFMVECFAIMMAGHVGFRMFRSRMVHGAAFGERVALYAVGGDTSELASQICNDVRGLHQLVGIYDDRLMRRPPGSEHLPWHGDLSALVQDCQAGLVDTVVLCLDTRAQARAQQLMSALLAASVNVTFSPIVMADRRVKLRPFFINGVLSIGLVDRPIDKWNGVTKWVEDYLIASLAVVLLSPVLLAAAIAIKLDSPGPVLFRQKRFGMNNRPFEVLKFRTMRTDRQDRSGAARTVKDDPRVTRVGRWFRKFSIDELPQLFNVLAGDMSIVGPRPHAVAMLVGETLYHETYLDYASRHRVKPGITGWAQINGSRGEVDSHEKARQRIDLDLYYVQNWSIGLDLLIILRTAIGQINDENAY